MALIACEKEINIDYHGHDTRYVVEGTIDGSGTEVRVSKTNAMDNNATGSDVDNATVKITADDGTTVYIPFSRNGYYRSKLKGVAGTTYQLDVEVDGQHFSSTSTMQSKPKMNEFRLNRHKKCMNFSKTIQTALLFHMMMTCTGYMRTIFQK